MKKSTSRSQHVERTDLYQQVTDRIVAALEKGVPPWRKPWRSVEKYASSPFPVNAATGCHYNGVNIMLLWLAAEEKGYHSNRWLTYKQAQSVGKSRWKIKAVASCLTPMANRLWNPGLWLNRCTCSMLNSAMVYQNPSLG